MPHYHLSPLQQVTAEFRFRPEEPWDMTIPGLLYERLRGAFPQRRSGRRVEVQTRMVEGQVVPVVRDAAGELQFVAKDGQSGVKVDVNQLAFQRVGAYPGWTALREQVLQVLGSYIEIGGPASFEALRLHFVNRIAMDLGQKNVDISRTLTVWPRVPPALATSFGKFLLKIDLLEPELKGHLVLTSGIADSTPTDKDVGLVLDLDFMSSDGPLPLDVAEGWLDGAHRRIAEAFELSITDDARRLFQGKS